MAVASPQGWGRLGLVRGPGGYVSEVDGVEFVVLVMKTLPGPIEKVMQRYEYAHELLCDSHVLGLLLGFCSICVGVLFAICASWHCVCLFSFDFCLPLLKPLLRYVGVLVLGPGSSL